MVSEGLESFGGQGYIEDTGLPSFFRDAQVGHGVHDSVIERPAGGKGEEEGRGRRGGGGMSFMSAVVPLPPQVLPIWEGTTNILGLDVLRVLSKAGTEVHVDCRSVNCQYTAWYTWKRQWP